VKDPQTLLNQDALEAGPGLLGWKLMSRLGGKVTGGIIIEVEAYHGPADPASHAHRGITPRTTPMFESAGAIYVYLSYGLHYCVNIVTGREGDGQALLIRALWPTDGIPVMQERRKGAPFERLTNGPANLTQSLGITIQQTGSRLGQELWLEPPKVALDKKLIITGPRVGISRAKELPWRFRLSPEAIRATMGR
jgi:DNA-3-methyladenine glycosylase